jgi:hypothetical protein
MNNVKVFGITCVLLYKRSLMVAICCINEYVAFTDLESIGLHLFHAFFVSVSSVWWNT